MFIWAIRQVGTEKWFERFSWNEFKPVFGKHMGIILSEDEAVQCLTYLEKMKSTAGMNLEIKKFQLVDDLPPGVVVLD